jgi:small ligand-binding sensory domain FIST
MPFASALSEHPLATQAVGEVVGEVLEQIGEVPDLAVLFVGAPHTGAIEDIAAAVRALLKPGVLVGCTAGAVVGRGREAEDVPALSLWAARLGARPVPLRLTAGRMGEGVAITGFPPPEDLPDDTAAVLLLADPFSFPVEPLLEGLRDQVRLDVPVVGGLASAARGPGGNRLVLDDRILTDGAVGVVLSGVDVETVVSQGCRPIGAPLIVTKGEGRILNELAGRPALERLANVIGSLDEDDRRLAARGLHVGMVIDESKIDFGPGDFLIRSVLGADREAGAVAVGDDVEVGSTVQFQVRDPASADAELHQLLAGRSADGALLFTCNGRGTAMFPEADHDAIVLEDMVGPVPVAGMSCAGEVGPVGGRNFVHGFTASVLLLRDRGLA